MVTYEKLIQEIFGTKPKKKGMVASYSPKQFIMETLNNYYTFTLVTTRLCRQFTMELNALLYLFVRGSKK